MTQLTFDTRELEDLFNTLALAINRTLDRDFLLFPLMRGQQDRTETRFRAEVDPDGRQWAPLAPSTLARKARKGAGGNPILVETGFLFNSLRIESSGSDSLDIVFGPEYGRFHNTGTRYMPARPFLGFSDGDVDVIENDAADRIVRELCDSIRRFR